MGEMRYKIFFIPAAVVLAAVLIYAVVGNETMVRHSMESTYDSYDTGITVTHVADSG